MALGHDTDCMCTPCMMEDMDRHLETIGYEPEWKGAEVAGAVGEPVRTRYAKPGQAAGTGFVRHVSEKQVRFIKSLMASRDTSKLVRLPGSEDIEHMSLRGARDLIDRLLGCPEKPKYVRPATPNQLSFIKSLCERKGMPDLSEDIVSFDKASETITNLKALQDKPKVTVTEAKPLTVGIYRHDDGRIVQVKPNQARTRMYGKLYDTESHCWTYEPGLLRGLTEVHRMTLEECKDLSVELGACCMCGRELTATVDGVPPRDRYIGPICAGKISG